MKRKWSVLLCLLTLVCLLCVSANAEEAPVIVEQPCTGIIQNGDFPEAPQPGLRMYASAQSADDALADVKAALKQGLLEMKASIDISQYRIPVETLWEIYPQVVNENPELFFVQGGCTCQSMGEIVSNVLPDYLWGKEVVNELTEEQKSQIRQKQTALEQVISGILAQVDPAWSDLETALFLHDYLATHAQYDKTIQFRDAYTILVKGTGVCQAYTLAYRLLLNRVNITSGTVTSTSLNHIWNILLIDGNWYHVDVTWDDPIEDRLGRVRHAYFCLSENKLKTTEGGKHYKAEDWEYSPTGITVDHTRFDNSHWANVDTAFVPLNRKWYYLLYQSGLMQTADPTQAGSRIIQISERWPEWGKPGWSWNGLYSGLSRYNDALIYNTPDTVYLYDLATGKARPVYSLTTAERAEGNIYGTVVDGNVLRYAVQQNPDHSMSTYTHRLDPYTAVTAGGYAYYLDEKTLHLKRDGAQSGSVIAAWYSEEDKLLGIQILNVLNGREVTANVSGAKTVKIFAAAQTGYRPLCEAILCTVE